MSRIKLIMCVVMTLVLCIMTLGYAALQERIDVEVEANIDSTYRVEITRVQEGTTDGDARSVQAPSYHDLTATFNVGLTNDTDYITYTIEVTNYSTVDVILNNTEITTTNDNISFIKSGIRNGNIILAGGVKTFTLKIKLDTETNAEQTGIITLTLDFTRLKGGVGDVINEEGLPNNYRTCEYMESTGTQYIDLDIKSKLSHAYELIVGDNSSVDSDAAGHFFGSGVTGIRYPSTGGIRMGFGNGNWLTTNVNVLSKNTIYLSKDKATFNSANVPYGKGVVINEILYLFATSNNQYGKIKIYSLKIYNDDSIIMELIPALDNNNVPCLYDTVSGETFYNAGTGDFIYQLKE